MKWWIWKHTRQKKWITLRDYNRQHHIYCRNKQPSREPGADNYRSGILLLCCKCAWFPDSSSQFCNNFRKNPLFYSSEIAIFLHCRYFMMLLYSRENKLQHIFHDFPSVVYYTYICSIHSLFSSSNVFS